MVRFRSKIGSWLALTALALQLMLSSAHVHLTILHGADCRTAIAGATAKTYKLPAPGPTTSGDYCAICASIQCPQIPTCRGFRNYPRFLNSEPSSSPPTSHWRF